MNKKAMMGIVELGIYFIFIIIVSVFILSFSFRYLNEKIDTTNLETFLMTKTITNSESCFAFKDDLRVHEGVIDLNKVNSVRLANCISKPTIGEVVTIKDSKGNILKTAKNLDARQEAYLPVCKNTNGYKCITKETPILYYENGVLSLGSIEVEAINFVE